MSKHYEWSGRIVVNQLDKCPFVSHMIEASIQYYDMNDGCLRCAMRYGNGWWCYYEILKSGTMKIVVSQRKEETHD